jgi:hypothetical protein
MRIPPASVIASWPIPNYEDPVTRGPSGSIICALFTVLVVLLLLIRAYTRLRIVRSFGLDDILIMIAFVRFNPSLFFLKVKKPCQANIVAQAPSFAFTVCGIYAGVNLGWERHLWDVPLSVLVPSSQLR